MSECCTCVCESCNPKPVTHTCTNCGGPMVKRVFPGDDTSEQYADALHVRIEGGYGMYIDAAGTALLCKQCAHKFHEAFPKIFEATEWKW